MTTKKDSFKTMQLAQFGNKNSEKNWGIVFLECVGMFSKPYDPGNTVDDCLKSAFVKKYF